MIWRAILDVAHAVLFVIGIPFRTAYVLGKRATGRSVFVLLLLGCIAVVWMLVYWMCTFAAAVSDSYLWQMLTWPLTH